jgi:hypothetical protein
MRRYLNTQRALLVLGATLALTACQAEQDLDDVPWLTSGEDAKVSEAVSSRVTRCSMPSDSLTVRAREEAAIETFTNVRSVIVLSSGRIVVADGRAFRLFVLDSAANTLDVIGGRGNGPGQFTSFAWARAWLGDTVAVLDPGRSRIAYIDVSNSRAKAADNPRVVEVQTPRQWVTQVIGPSVDGNFVTVPVQSKDRHRARPPQGRIHRDTLLYSLMSSTGEITDTLGLYLGDETYPLSLTEQGQTMEYSAPAPLGRRTLAGVTGHKLWVVDNGSAKAQLVDLRTRSRTITRLLSDPSRALTSAEKKTYAAKYVDSRRQVFRPMLQRALDEIGSDRPAPLLGDLVTNTLESIVAVSLFNSGTSSLTKWFLFTGEGKSLGCTQLPADRQVVGVGGRNFITIGRDEFDVEYIVIYRR